MSIFWLLLAAVVGGVINRARGTKSYLVWPAGAVVAAAVWWFLEPPIWQALAVGGLYVLGENWGWTLWIRTVPGLTNPQDPDSAPLTASLYKKLAMEDDTGRVPGYRYLVDALFKPGEAHSWFGMTLRAAVWWLPVYAALWWFMGGAVWPFALAAVVSSVGMPLCYFFGSRHKVGSFRYLASSEVYYGAWYGAVLAATLLLA